MMEPSPSSGSFLVVGVIAEVVTLIHTTVEDTHLHPLCESWNIVSQAEWPKSRRETGEKMLILTFSDGFVFWALVSNHD